MVDRRRESLGRNRQGPPPPKAGAFYLGIAAMITASIFGYYYLTEPHRVLGSKILDCKPWEITWQAGPKTVQIQGCGRQMQAKCDDEAKRCVEVQDP